MVFPRLCDSPVYRDVDHDTWEKPFCKAQDVDDLLSKLINLLCQRLCESHGELHFHTCTFPDEAGGVVFTQP